MVGGGGRVGGGKGSGVCGWQRWWGWVGGGKGGGWVCVCGRGKGGGGVCEGARVVGVCVGGQRWWGSCGGQGVCGCEEDG